MRQRRCGRDVIFPVEVVENQLAAACQPSRSLTIAAWTVRHVRKTPALAAADGPGIGIEHDYFRIEAMAGPRRKRPVHAVAVQDIRSDAVHENMPDVAGLVNGRIERDFGDGFFLSL